MPELSMANHAESAMDQIERTVRSTMVVKAVCLLVPLAQLAQQRFQQRCHVRYAETLLVPTHHMRLGCP